ncbi:MAG: hypothetical protein JKY09_05055, partial [Crocinitomicaceae bacterium]|nr:hypothetical protein [Crocinitomicaceae bacterium]
MNRLKVFNFIGLLILSTSIFGQKVGKSAVSMNSCEGAINILEDGEFRLKFTGKTNGNPVSNYSSLEALSSKNLLWCSFIASTTGDLTFHANVKNEFIQMVIFEEGAGDICGEIKSGASEIKRLHISKDYKTLGLDYKVDNSVLYAFPMERGQKIYAVFATEEGAKEELFLQWRFIPEELLQLETKIVDKRNDDFAPTLSFRLRDEESGLPIIGGLVLEGTRTLEGLYTGSDFFFNIERACKIFVKCDIEGYFFHDSLYELNGFEDVEISIPMEKIASGRSMNIEEIEFIPGTSEILKSSEPKLRRVK